MTAQLDSGIRFLDFRIMYTQAPDKDRGAKDWYCLHGCQTKKTSLEYLTQLKDWLVAHPTEIVVLWSSRHGDTRISGTDQYPDTTPADRQLFWRQVEALFGSLLFDTAAAPLSAVPVKELRARGQRLIWYAADWAEFTGNSTKAIDNKQIDNQLTGSITNERSGSASQIALFHSAAATRQKDKEADRFFLASMADSTPSTVLESAAELTFLPFIDKKRNTANCANVFNGDGGPNVTGWCPLTLMDCSLLANYWNQRTLEAAYQDPDSDFPNAIYIDAIDIGGAIRTGTQLINPLTKVHEPTSTAHNNTGYSYVATLVGANVKRLCRSDAAPRAACSSALSEVEAERSRLPLQLWDDQMHGRSTAPA